MAKGEIIGLIISFLVCTVWFAFSYWNYRTFKTNLEWFKARYHYYIRMEKNAGHITPQAEYFNKRETLVHNYSFLYIEMEKEMNDPHYWKKLFVQYALMGFIYNLT